MKKVFTRSHKTRPMAHSMKVAGSEKGKEKHFSRKQAITHEFLKLVLQEVVEANIICRFKRG